MSAESGTERPMSENEIVQALEALRGSIEEYRIMADRITALETRMHDLDIDLIKYRKFIDESSGFLTRLGFYADAAVLWLKKKFLIGGR